MSILTGDKIAGAQLLARRAALKLEVTGPSGMRFSSKYSIAQVCREAYGIKYRSKAKVLEEMNKLCADLLGQ